MTLRTTLRRAGACALAAATAGAVAISLPASAAAATPTQPQGSIAGSTAQGANVDLAGVTAPASNPPTSASNDGSQSNAQQTGSPSSGLLSDATFLQAGALKEVAAANEHGFAYSCAGIVSPTGDLHVGETPDGVQCTVTGNATGGFGLDLSQLAGGLGSTLSGIANVKLTADSITAHAYQDAHGPLVRGATISNLQLQVELLGGALPAFTVPLSISSADGTLEPNENLLTAIVEGLTSEQESLGPITGLLLVPVIDAVSDLLSNVVSLTANYQPAGSGSVSALHAEMLNGTGTMDLATAAVGVGCTVKPFNDVWKSNPFCVDITWSLKQYVTYGSSPTDHNYRPRALVTRGQFAAFLHRLVESGTASAPCTGPKPFQDVPKHNTFCQDITWLKNSDISEGFTGNEFHVGAPLTRQNIAAQLYRLAHNGSHAPNCSASDHPFPDVNSDTNFCGAIKWLKSTGIARGDSHGMFNPRDNVTRQSMAGFLNQYDRYLLS